jgi:hypothetical protein
MIDAVLDELALGEYFSKLTRFELIEIVCSLGTSANDAVLADCTTFVKGERSFQSELLHVGTGGRIFTAVSDVFRIDPDLRFCRGLTGYIMIA